MPTHKDPFQSFQGVKKGEKELQNKEAEQEIGKIRFFSQAAVICREQVPYVSE